MLLAGLSASMTLCGESPSQNIKPQKPPNQKNADNCHGNVTDPLARRLWVSEVEHVAMVAPALKQDRNESVTKVRFLAL